MTYPDDLFSAFSISSFNSRGNAGGVFASGGGGYSATGLYDPTLETVLVSAERFGPDIVLTWPVSPEAESYQVWRSPQPNFQPGDPGSLPLDDIPVPPGWTEPLQFSDLNAAIDGNNYYYRLLEFSLVGDDLSNEVGKHVVQLAPDYNFVSLPLLPQDTALDPVLGSDFFGTTDPLTADRILVWDSVTQSYESAWYCGGPDCEAWGDPWYEHWLTPDYNQSDLLLEPNAGFWFENRSGLPEQWIVVGPVVEHARPKVVIDGWNALGSNALQPRPLEELLLPAFGTADPLTADNLLTWDPGSQEYQTAWYCGGPDCEAWGEPWYQHWLTPDYAPSPLTVEPGEGFLYQNRDTTFEWWDLPYQLVE